MAIVELSQKFFIEVAHRMPSFPADHPNNRIHGHSYEVVVTLKGPINSQTGVLIKMEDFQSQLELVREKIDHRMLNDLPGLEIPSSENISRWIWKELSQRFSNLYSVSVERPNLGLKITYKDEK